jgi:hypothetical protein
MRGAAPLILAALCVAGLAPAPSVAAGPGEAPLNLPREIGRRIALGRPRITYVKAAGGPDGSAALANSIFAAIGACPLRFTPTLGAAIAGRVFTVRFVAPRKQFKAAL